MPHVPKIPGRSGSSSNARWDKHNSERRTKILDAAVELIEESAAGVEVSVKDIADRAGLARSVVYRQFEDKDDLDAQVRTFVISRFMDNFESALVLEGRIDDVILAVMTKVVDEAADHPRLYYLVQTGTARGAEPGDNAMATLRSRIADTLWRRLAPFTGMLGIDSRTTEPMAYGIAAMVEGIIARCIYTPAADFDRAEVARLVTDATWYLLDGNARARGIEIDQYSDVSATLIGLFARLNEARAH